MTSNNAEPFIAARDFLLRHREDYDTAYRDFKWPKLDRFNWALDYFDEIARGNAQPALWIVDEDAGETKLSFAQLSERSNRVANYAARPRRAARRSHPADARQCRAAVGMHAGGDEARRGDRAGDDAADAQRSRRPLRARRRAARHRRQPTQRQNSPICPATTRASPSAATHRAGLRTRRAMQRHAEFTPDGATTRRRSDAALFHLRHDGEAEARAAQPSKLSGRASVDDVLARPAAGRRASEHFLAGLGQARLELLLCAVERRRLRLHRQPAALQCAAACSTPWCAAASPRSARRRRCGACSSRRSSRHWKMPLRELIGAGEPLNPEVIEQVQGRWGLTIRDGYGQTETTAQVGNTPGQKVKPGSMGRPLPGYRVALLDVDDTAAKGRRDLPDARAAPDRPDAGLSGRRRRRLRAMAGDVYRTGDVASLDDDGYLTYVGRADDVFKSSDYRISPFELESVLIEHPAVAEAAVVPSPDPMRLAVPKAFMALAAGHAPDRATALSIFQHCRDGAGAVQAGAPDRVRRIAEDDLRKNPPSRTAAGGGDEPAGRQSRVSRILGGGFLRHRDRRTR